VSTTILGDNLPPVGSYHSSLFSVDSRRAESLGEYVRRVRTDKGLSTTDVETASRRGGAKGISDAYVTRIENGHVTNVSPAKLEALAQGLGVNPEELYARVRGMPLGPMSPTDFQTALQALGVEQFQAYGGVENLTDEDRQEIIAMLETMIEQKLMRRQKAAASVKGSSKLARVASPLHSPGWETQAGPARGREKPVFSARKKDKKSRQA
jgi:transcriptional regulator with XRE-family HTH domain